MRTLIACSFTIFAVCSIMKRKCKQRWSTIPPISTKRTSTSQLKSLNTIKTMTNDVGNLGPGQAHRCGRVKPVNGMILVCKLTN